MFSLPIQAVQSEKEDAVTSNECCLCPRSCKIDRTTPAGLKRSLCKAGKEVELALVSLHPWEEPCLSGKNGAGTVFFSHCNLRCCFCQNYEISAMGKGWKVTPAQLTDIFLKQQDRGATCLELVTPTHYADTIARCLKDAKNAGLTIPVAYNSNGYDKPDTLRFFQGLVDIWLPDLKYFDSTLGAKYSGVPHYFEYASEAIKTMVDLAKPWQQNSEGILQSGVIVRHLVLPGLWKDSIRCVDWLYDNFGDRICLSLMNQYMPLYKASRHPEINRPLMTVEYQKVIRHARNRGITKSFIQIGRTDSSKFIPNFDGSGITE